MYTGKPNPRQDSDRGIMPLTPGSVTTLTETFTDRCCPVTDCYDHNDPTRTFLEEAYCDKNVFGEAAFANIPCQDTCQETPQGAFCTPV